MKMNVFKVGLLAAITIGFAAGCSEKEQTSLKGGETIDGMVLSASVVEGTKTFLDGPVQGAYQALWKTGDKVSVNGNLSEAVTEAQNGLQDINFVINGTLSAPFKVLYPGTTSSNVITLPATQNYSAGSFDGSAAAAFGNAVQDGEHYIVSLTSFCGILRFALNGDAEIDKIEFNSLGTEKLFGEFTLATDAAGFTGAWSGGTAGTLTYDCGVTLTTSDTYFYVVIPAQTYASGLEAKVYQADGAFMRLKFWGTGNTLKSTDVVEFESKTFAAGRTEDVFSISDLAAEDGGEPTVTPPGITVATFNVMRLDPDNRPSAATTGDSSGRIARPEGAIAPGCAAMQEALGQAIVRTAADLIGFQEIGDDMYKTGQTYSLQDIAAAQGASYTWKLDFPGSQSGNYHYCNGFAHRSSVLTLNESGRAWLRTGSSSYSTSSDSGSGDPNRYVVWGLFTHKLSGKQFYFFVTQLPTYSQDGGSGTSNLNMSGGVNAFAASKTLSPTRQILVGDMNSVDHSSSSNQAGAQKLKEYWTDAYEAVNTAGNLSSFYQTYSGTQSGTGESWQYSILQYCKNHPERRLDHIMTKGSCTAQSYKTIRNTYEFGEGDNEVTCAPSDHLPVVAYITLE